jgi:hypothetical protein
VTRLGSPESTPEQRFPSMLAALLTALFCFYCADFLYYRPYDIDNTWFLSFSYGFGVDGVPSDQFMHAPFPFGMDGTHLFGKIAAALQTLVLRPFDWQQRPAQILSSLLIVASLCCLAGALRRMRYSPALILCFVTMAGISEPLLSAAERFRYEPVSFLMASCGVLLATFGSTFWAVFIAAMAVEVQPIAVLGVLPVVTLCLLSKMELRSMLKVMLAGALAACLHLLMHPEFLHPSALVQRLGGASSFGYPGQLRYFLEGRHQIESVLPLAAAVLVVVRWRTLRQHHLWAVLCCVLTCVAGMMFRHPNPAYMIFLYPWLILLVLAALPTPRSWVVATIVFGLYFLPEYGYAAWQNRGQGYSHADILRVRTALAAASQRHGLNPAALNIVGDYGLWYVHPHNYHANGWGSWGDFPGADAVLCYPAIMPGLSRPTMMYCGDLVRAMPDLRLDSTLSMHGNTLNIFFRDRSSPAKDGALRRSR